MKFCFQLVCVLVLCVACVSAFLPTPAILGRSSGSCSRLARSDRAVGGLKMVDIAVAVNDGEPIESALRRFKVLWNISMKFYMF